jgi:hypothetical protein
MFRDSDYWVRYLAVDIFSQVVESGTYINLPELVVDNLPVDPLKTYAKEGIPQLINLMSDEPLLDRSYTAIALNRLASHSKYSLFYALHCSTQLLVDTHDAICAHIPLFARMFAGQNSKLRVELIGILSKLSINCKSCHNLKSFLKN